MAIGDPYIDVANLKSYLSIPSNISGHDQRLSDAIDSASAEIEQYTGRQFNKTDTATPRVFEVDSKRSVTVDDFHTTDDLVVEVSHNGGETYTEVTDYTLHPRDGVMDGQPGWPFYKIRRDFYSYDKHCHDLLVRVTAKWGWVAVPATVAQSCRILAGQTYKLADAPFGVTGMELSSGGGFGGLIRVRDMPQMASKLSRFIARRIMVG